MKNIIELSINPQRQIWEAEYFGPDRGQIYLQFGSPKLPTSFRAKCSFNEVRKTIELRNPGYVVIEKS